MLFVANSLGCSTQYNMSSGVDFCIIGYQIKRNIITLIFAKIHTCLSLSWGATKISDSWLILILDLTYDSIFGFSIFVTCEVFMWQRRFGVQIRSRYYFLSLSPSTGICFSSESTSSVRISMRYHNNNDIRTIILKERNCLSWDSNRG